MLSLIWKHKNIYNIVNEDIIQENTFTQTSGGENLWKSQLGITENHLIILKCEIDISDSTSQFINNNRIIIHMEPMKQLKFMKCPGRRLKIIFPKEIKSFFKLVFSERCAWPQWSRLENLCRKDSRSISSRWVLIPFGKLEPKVQQYLRNKQFLQPVTIDINDVDIISSKEEKPIFTDLKEAGNTSTGNNLLNTEKDIKSSTYVLGYRSSNLSKMSKSQKRLQLVNRFGEGIPEGCLYGLYLSDDVSSVENVGQPSKLSNVPKWNDLNDSSNVSAQKLALAYIIRLEQNIRNERRKEKTLMRTLMVKYTENFNDKSKNNHETEICRNLKTARCFRISSSIFFPTGIRRSCSIDSLPKIDPCNNEYSYLTANLSLPSLDEIDFCRRTHRLSYSLDFKDEVAQLETPISFWIPKSGQFCQGRMYTADPVSQKYEAMQFRRMKANLNRSISNLDIIHEESNKESTDEVQRWITYSPDFFIKNILKDIVNEYPVHHSLWSESPRNKYKTNPINDATKNTDKKEIQDKPKNSGSKNLVGKSNSQLPDKKFKQIRDINPHLMAIELRRIQLMLFCSIENGEIARLIVKPRSVTEINCPYLFANLYFNKRIENMVVSELLAKSKDSNKAEVLSYFIKVAFHCFKNRNKQSCYTILSGLCHPKVLENATVWSVFYQHHKKEFRTFQSLLETRWKATNTCRTNKNIPVFRSLIDMLFEVLLQKQEISNMNSGLKKLWRFLTRWSGNNMTENNYLKTFFRHLTMIFNSQDKLTLGKKDLQEILDVIEESRQNYCFTIQNRPFDETTQDVLLLKEY
ncbi:hypothetical protein JTE90_023360 [Oedothorax gibbosus]|uniref:Ras-GEF domain-containing protein n=1 Tax=Oedothorax gibbosus TaxID=931172 RepID=A0AAV6U9P0_9ARAC|nr:hypothetical protein JTE90_023360 [Oedothorax gibbosus]